MKTRKTLYLGVAATAAAALLTACLSTQGTGSAGASDIGADLYRAHIDYSGQKPDVTFDSASGRLTISQRGNNFMFLQSQQFAVKLELNSNVVWTVELDTGATTLSFASHELGKANLPDGFAAHDPSGPPLAVEIALVDDDVPAAHARAVEAGARELSPPKQKPWGQTVSDVRDPNGVLIELCSPMT